MNIADVQEIVSTAIGGDTIGETAEGLARYPVSVRYPREMRDSLERLRQLPVLTARGTDDDDRPAFVREDGRYVSARWPGDAYAFAKALLKRL